MRHRRISQLLLPLLGAFAVVVLAAALSGCSAVIDRALYPDGKGPCGYLPEGDVERVLGEKLKPSYGSPLSGGASSTDWYCSYNAGDRMHSLSFDYRCFQHEADAKVAFADHAEFLYLRAFTNVSGLGDGAHWVVPDTKSGFHGMGSDGLLSVRIGSEVFSLHTQDMGTLPLAKARSLAETVLAKRGNGSSCYKG